MIGGAGAAKLTFHHGIFFHHFGVEKIDSAPLNLRFPYLN